MVSKENSVEQKLCLYFIFHHKIAFRDFFIPQATGKIFYTYYYQIPQALYDELAWAGARGTGKSYDLEFTLLQIPFHKLAPGEETVVTAYRKTHVKDRLERVISYFANTPYLRRFLYGDNMSSLKESVTRTPIYLIKFKNKHEIFGISVGDDPQAVAIAGKHPKFRFGDEMQFYTSSAWLVYQSTQHPSGSLDRYYGVANGILGEPFDEILHHNKKFKNRIFRIHRALEPNWTQEMKRDKLASLKGPKSNDWLQQIEAQDGEPSFGVWSEADLKKCMDFSEMPDIPGVYANEMRVITVLAKDYVDMSPAQVLYNLPLLPDGTEDVILGIDAGYAQPTIILPFFYHNGKWNLRCKIFLLDRMISDDQTELVDYVATFYKANLGIDTSSAEGRDIATSLCNPKNEEYANKQYDKRVYFIDFREAIIIGYKRIKDGATDRVVVQEVTDHMKSLTTSLLRNKFYGSEFDIYHDEELIPDFLSETQKKVGERTEIRTPTDVHSTDAFRCFVGAWWKLKVVVEKPNLEEDEAEEYDMVFPSYELNENRLFQSKPDKTELS